MSKSHPELLLRYALFSRMAYLDYDITPEELSVLKHVSKISFVDKKEAQVWIFLDTLENELVISFRGSDSLGDILANFCIVPTKFMDDKKALGHVHLGHQTCYKIVRESILKTIQDQKPAKVTVCGHSLGGACATLCALDIAKVFRNASLQIQCYSYGAPAVGDRNFWKEILHLVPNTYRIVHSEDFAPFVPMIFFRNYTDQQELFIRLPTCDQELLREGEACSLAPGINEKHGFKHIIALKTEMHSKAKNYIRHHSIESYIGSLKRKLLKTTAQIKTPSKKHNPSIHRKFDQKCYIRI